ncbi:MAG TPA: response regulator transcription factor [Ktedonobacterales bacterium]|nr:response regulator transcription factor [Ktedonobacterales bacterium]
MPSEPAPPRRIRVLLVDDQALLRESFRRLLELESDDIEVIGAAADGQDALELIERLCRAGGPPDVVLMDIRMPRLNGVEATRELKRRWPAIRVVMLTTFDDEEYIVDGLRAGARGYLLKDTSSDQLVQAIRAAHRGEAPLQPSVAVKLVARIARADPPDHAPPLAAAGVPQRAGLIPSDDLTERERDILRLLARGDSNREIGETLFITEGTVKNHVSSILSKLALRDRTQAALWAREHGLLEPR